FRVAIKQFNRNALRPAQETYFDAGAGGVRLLGELDAFLFQIGGYGIDPGNCPAEVVGALIRRRPSGIAAVAGVYLSSKNHRTAELDVDARFSKLGAADDLGAEHALEPLCHRRRIGRAQVDVIPGKVRHWHFSLNGLAKLA